MSDIATTVRYLYNLQLFGVKMGLKNIRELLQTIDNPERKFPCVHVAGTNGKGSTSSMIASVLSASGYKTGLYTSPHLVQFNERIRIDGRAISSDVIIASIKELRPAIGRMHATFFEATTAVAFKYFADQKVDVAVIETGLGGRLDATNAVTPMVSIITNIGLDHKEHLGTTYKAIAREKAGIIKESIPCIMGGGERSACLVIGKVARSKHSRLFDVQKASTGVLHDCTLAGLDVSIKTNRGSRNHLHVSLCGGHQLRNAQTAILALDLLKDLGWKRISDSSLRDGLLSVREKSGLRGRLELLQTSPLIIADVAHNPDGIRAVIRALRQIVSGTWVAVFGVMRDKDYPAMIDQLGPVARMTIAVQPPGDRALSSRSIVTEFHRRSRRSIDGGSVEQGLEIARKEVRKNEPIVVLGSHYVVGEAIEALASREGTGATRAVFRGRTPESMKI